MPPSSSSSSSSSQRQQKRLAQSLLASFPLLVSLHAFLAKPAGGRAQRPALWVPLAVHIAQVESLAEKGSSGELQGFLAVTAQLLHSLGDVLDKAEKRGKTYSRALGADEARALVRLGKTHGSSGRGRDHADWKRRCLDQVRAISPALLVPSPLDPLCHALLLLPPGSVSDFTLQMDLSTSNAVRPLFPPQAVHRRLALFCRCTVPGRPGPTDEHVQGAVEWLLAGLGRLEIEDSARAVRPAARRRREPRSAQGRPLFRSNSSGSDSSQGSSSCSSSSSSSSSSGEESMSSSGHSASSSFSPSSSALSRPRVDFALYRQHLDFTILSPFLPSPCASSKTTLPLPPPPVHLQTLARSRSVARPRVATGSVGARPLVSFAGLRLLEAGEATTGWLEEQVPGHLWQGMLLGG